MKNKVHEDSYEAIFRLYTRVCQIQKDFSKHGLMVEIMYLCVV